MPADNPHITVVNDNPDFLQLMHTLLAEDSGYDVTTIDGDSLRDIEPIRRSHPDLMVIDLRWRGDGLSGWDILMAVRRDPALSELPIILCTGDLGGLEEHADAIAQDSRVVTLPKPFQVVEMEDLVRRFVGEAAPSK